MQKIEKDKLVIYDIETLINCITFCFLDYKTKNKKEFVIFDDVNQVYELMSFLKRLKNNNYSLVGFNNVRFDAQFIEKLLSIYEGSSNYKDWTVDQFIMIIYNLSQKIINCPDEQKFDLLIPEFKFQIPQIDIFLQKHYDRPQKATSLKWLQFTMRHHTVEELPISHDVLITKEQIPDILKYNWNDVESTATAFENFMFETDLRLSLSEKYKKNLINASEPKLAREIFGTYLCDEMKISYRELKQMNTLYNDIKVKDIIFPYIKFQTESFNELHKALLNTILTPEQKLEYTINVFGLDATFALGGLHSNNKPLKVKEDENNIILTSDVASMYPNLAIQNNLKPKHLGNVFNKVYSFLYDERKKYPKSDPLNYVFKIILNSVYGLSSEKNSYLYDVSFTRAICINGELSLLMLCEMVKLAIPEVIFIMLNTDGIEVKIPRGKQELYYEVCAKWEKVTKLILEHSQYKSMYIIDVNNYMAIDIKDNIKKKARFEYDMDYHKNPSFIVVAKAVEAYFNKGQDYKTFIDNHEDIFDYLGAVKKKSNFKLELYYLDKGELKTNYGQKVTRFYVAKKGKKFYKKFNDGRQVGIVTDWLVETAYNITDSEVEKIRNNLDLRYYYKEAEKIIFEIEGNSNQLSLF